MNRILIRLILYFIASFAIFAIIGGIVFFALFSRHNMNLHTAELERRAITIANTLATPVPNMMRGHTLNLIEDIAMGDVWVIDGNLQQITVGRGRMRRMGHGGHMGQHHVQHNQLTIPYRELPAAATEVISNAMLGEISVSESFGIFFDEPAITIAAPIINNFGIITGVVLLHSEISNVTDITDSGLIILLLSTIAAIVVSICIAIIFSSYFVNPLKKMHNVAVRISGGDYSIKTGIKQTDEVGRLASALDDMAERLEKSSKESEKLEQMRRDFTANISHELRTPITVIKGSLAALCDNVITEPSKVSDYHNQMLTESIYLERLVNDLLDLSSLQNLDFAIEMQNLDLLELINDAIRSMERIAESKNVRIVFSQKTTIEVLGDYGRLRQMIIIVLDNAIKFSPDNATVEVTLSKNGDLTELAISDEGPGIADSTHIFTKFYKQRSEQNRTGTGLGLPIAKQIADRHGISINLTPKQKTTFTFSF